ncbi:MAG: CHRD domain-containing protein [Bryobacterales bacterium]|nr:CHRD domain-containing protein [Bryobacterales bacterium]
MICMCKAFVAMVLLAFCAAAQAPEMFKTRLAPVAVDLAMLATIAGEGSASATLAGNKLSVKGTFGGLKSAATVAHIHQGTATGVRGARVLDLTVTKDVKGEVSGAFDLQPEQLEALRKGRWYIQIHSEKAPDGNLWGWLLK